MVAKMLQRPALVLNRNWQPVNVATVARALVLLWNESARRRAFHPGRAVSAASAGSDHVDRLRPTSLRGSRVQPSEHIQA